VRLRPGVIFLLALCFTVSAGAAWADGVPVANASFETINPANPLNLPCGIGCAYNGGSIPDWTLTGTGGSFQPNTTFFNLPLPNGSIVAYSNGGTISQILGVTVQPDSTYTLSVYVGDRLGNEVANYSIALDDGSTTLCSTPTASNGAITHGTFADITLTCSTGATVAPGDLAIVLTSSGTQIDFDNVALNVQTPEPASYLLLCIGLGSMFVFFRYRRAGVSS
jgi:hypothetical protein